MTNYDWKFDLSNWIRKKRKNSEFENDLIDFFSNVFSNARIPEKYYFGTTKNSVSLLVGGIYLGAYVHSGNDKGIWLLLDKELHPIKDIEYKPVLSTKTSKIKLTWLHSENINNLSLINRDSSVWISYSLASLKVVETPKGLSTRKDFLKNKVLLSSFWNQQDVLIDSIQLNKDLDREVSVSKKLSKEERLKRLKNARTIPERIVTKTTAFKRNPHVIAEVLERANGFCEVCKNPAPFIKDLDNTPYLEVHHIIQLSKGGEDTVENSIALCPNCHRHAHFGERTFKNSFN